MTTYNHEEQKNTLFKLENILKENNFKEKCHMGFGLFLGAIRQKKLNTFLNNWDDLDFNIKEENWEEFVNVILPILKQNNFKVLHRFQTIFNAIGEITITHGNDRIDFHQNFLVNDRYFHYAWYGGVELGKALNKEYFLNIQEYEIENVTLYGPIQFEQYLCDLYGDSWRIPCTSEDEYKFWHDEPGIPWTTKKRNEIIIRGDYP